MDDHLVAALEDEHDGLEQARLGVEAEPQFAVRQVVLVEGAVAETGRLRSARPVLVAAGEPTNDELLDAEREERL